MEVRDTKVSGSRVNRLDLVLTFGQMVILTMAISLMVSKKDLDLILSLLREQDSLVIGLRVRDTNSEFTYSKMVGSIVDTSMATSSMDGENNFGLMVM